MIALLGAASLSYAQTDSVRLSDVVVTGTRYRSDIRHLPLEVSVINRSRLTAAYQPSVLPTLSQQVPGLFITTRGILGYGLSTGAAGTFLKTMRRKEKWDKETTKWSKAFRWLLRNFAADRKKK